ncbi:MAG: glycosyltransferase family 2 protein [Microthrixaceae bacterium]|nr:glycosyltransferase family 2 protein [Microthrixaceae bacterium]
MTRPRIAICVVTFDSAPLIKDLVDSIPLGAEGTDWTLVFADNASADSTVAEIERHAPDARVVETGANLGYSGGVNAAIHAAGDQDAYLILNADVRLEAGCLVTLFDSLGPSVGIAVPRLIDSERQPIWSMRREPSLLRAWSDALFGAERAGRLGALGEVVTRPELYASSRRTDWAEGSTQLISAECLSVCGAWDESFFLYSEETDYNLRARDHGFPVLYVAGATAQHLKGESSASPELWSLLVLNKARLYARRHGAIASVLFWFALVIREASRTALGKRTSRAALRDLLRPQRWRAQRGPAWLAGVRS